MKRTIPPIRPRSVTGRTLAIWAAWMGLAAFAVALGSRGRSGILERRISHASGLLSVAAEELPGSPCRMNSDPLLRVEEPGGITLSTSLRSSSRTAISLRLLQAAWSGPFRLRSVRLGGTVIPVGVGSPAVVALGESAGMTVAAGESLSVALDFVRDSGEPPAELSLGPILFLSADGCTLPLFEPLAFADGRCGLAIQAPRVALERSNLVEWVLENRGRQYLQPNALEVVWPVAQNGKLIGWQLAYRPPAIGGVSAPLPPGLLTRGLAPSPSQQLPTPPPGTDLGRSPVLLSLRGLTRDLLPKGGLPPRGTLVVTLAFQREAATAGYRLSVTTDESCRTNWSDLAQDNGCAVSLQRLKLEQRTVAVQLGNSGGLTTTLRSLSLQWSQRSAGALAEVWLGGKLLRKVKDGAAPYEVLLDPPLPVLPGKFIELALVFDGGERAGPTRGTAAEGVSDDPGDSTGLGELAILARFSDGCGAVLSTLRPDQQLGCRVAATDIVPDSLTTDDANDVVVTISNDGANTLLRQIALNWPVHNGALVGAWIDDRALLTDPLPHDPAAARLLNPPPDLPLIAHGTNARLRLRFAKPAARLGYSALLSFVDGAGNPCSEVRVSSPASEPDCQLGTELRIVDDGQADLYIQNRGQDPLALSEIRIDWPKSDGWQLTRLLGAAIVRGSEDELDLGLAPNLAPPVTVRLAERKLETVSIPAGSDGVHLSLRFAQLRDSGQLKDALKVSLAFAEGCRTVFPRDGSLPGPHRAVVDGTVIRLPGADTLYTGTWLLRDSQGQVWSVEVSADTLLVPSSFVPRVDDRVEAQLVADPAGLWWASQIILRSGRPERKLVGELTGIQPGSQPSGLPESIQLDDQRVVLVEGFSQVDRPADLQLGATVVAEGIVDRQNRFLATRVELVTPSVIRPEAITFRGVVQGGAPPGPNPPFLNVVMSWTVTPFTVFAGADLTARLALQPQLLGRTVEVRGERLGDNVLATDMVVLAAPASPQRMEGVLIGLPASGLQGDWTIDRGVAGRSDLVVVHVPDLAVIDTREAPALVGNRVRAIVRDVDGVRVALGIHVQWP